MDVADFEIIVQWRATCSSTTYWQRGGRGARDRRIEATYVFLVDKEHFEKDVELGDRGEKRKSDTHQADNNLPVKRHKPSSSNEDTPNLLLGGEGVDTAVNDDATALRDTLQAKYFELGGNQKGENQPKRRKRELDPVLADIVNAERRGIRCRRFPILAALENEKAGEYNLPVQDS